MKHLYFIRHGESEANRRGVLAGRYDTPLTEEGREQAVQAGKDIPETSIIFDVVMSSPLSRAHDTATIISDATGFNGSVEVMDELQERSFGDASNNRPEDFGMTHEQAAADERVMDALPNAESLEDLSARAQKLLDSIKKREEDTILLVGHGAFGRAIKRILESKKYYETVDQIPNAKLIKLI